MDKELMESIRKLLKEELEPIKTEIKGLKKGQSSFKRTSSRLENRARGNKNYAWRARS